MYGSELQTALAKVIARLLEREIKHGKRKGKKTHLKGYLKKLQTISKPSDIPRTFLRYWEWWYLIEQTTNSEGALLILEMIKVYQEWASIPWGDELNDWIFDFAQENQARCGFTDEFIELLSLGLGPWPKGNGTE
ncbi:MAG: hypothetical protein ACFFCX_16860 [Candidatus Sifarchaeia archaeon]